MDQSGEHTSLCKFYFLKFILNNVVLAVLDLHCFGWIFSSCRERGMLFIEVRRFLTVWLLLL